MLRGLVKRRAERAGKVERLHETMRKLVADLETQTATIRRFSTDFQVEAIKPKGFWPPKDWSNRDQMSQMVLSLLRQAADPLTSRELTLELMVTRAFDKDDKTVLKAMTKREGAALNTQRENGVVRSAQGLGHIALWAVAR